MMLHSEIGKNVIGMDFCVAFGLKMYRLRDSDKTKNLSFQPLLLSIGWWAGCGVDDELERLDTHSKQRIKSYVDCDACIWPRVICAKASSETPSNALRDTDFARFRPGAAAAAGGASATKLPMLLAWLARRSPTRLSSWGSTLRPRMPEGVAALPTADGDVGDRTENSERESIRRSSLDVPCVGVLRPSVFPLVLLLIRRGWGEAFEAERNEGDARG
ncbi:hypothetical protein BDR26DRAFT_877798 [Obelidium mucronatum]|nr:hypothetical protein BDR26DRAFT_877798 [Obelidium mucronatum]